MGRIYRLTRQEVIYTIKNGLFKSNPFFSARVLNVKKGFKLAIISPKKVFRLATTRNRARRRFVGALRAVLPAVQNNSSHIVFFLKQPCLNSPIEDLIVEVKKFMQL